MNMPNINPDVIARLEKLLGEAKKGEITQFSYVAYGGGRTNWGHNGCTTDLLATGATIHTKMALDALTQESTPGKKEKS